LLLNKNIGRVKDSCLSKQINQNTIYQPASTVEVLGEDLRVKRKEAELLQ
jgi:hypothetical protein